MPDRLTVILPPILSDEERIAEALGYSSRTDGFGDGSGYSDSLGYGYGDGFGFGVGDGDGGSSTDV